jgi:hypothetical protein
MNSTESKPTTPEHQDGKQAITAVSQIAAGFVKLLRMAGGLIVHVTSGLFSFIASKLDHFVSLNFTSQAATGSALRVLQKLAAAVSSFIRTRQLSDLDKAPLIVRVAVIGILVLVSYGTISVLFRTGPPSGIVETAISRDIGGIGIPLPNGQAFHEDHLKSFKITNRYTKRIDDEKFYIYDYAAEVDGLRGHRRFTGSIHLVKRGAGWYSE